MMYKKLFQESRDYMLSSLVEYQYFRLAIVKKDYIE